MSGPVSGVQYNVSYSILFTKRDHEATLSEQKQEIVSYSTDGGSFGGLKIGSFFGELAKGDLPTVWRDNGGLNDEGKEVLTPDGGGYTFKSDQEKYIHFVYEVVQRLDKSEKEYDKEKAEALREIAQNTKRDPQPPSE
jgi:hypothetical protein